MVQGLKDGLPVWANGIIAPDLFSSAETIGKTSYVNKEYSLGFYRQGGTYTLSYVLNNNTGEYVASNLREFMTTAGGLTNEFWAMDGSASHGTDGHDLKFGIGDPYNHVVNQVTNRRYCGEAEVVIDDYKSTEDFPITDIGTVDHNSYFGMSYTVDFTVAPGYCAPLEYWFYGDDDMWVFLQELDEKGNPIGNAKLVADIGGVHLTEGEFVNLWDYVDEIPYTTKDEVTGEEKENTAQAYRLSVFYTERGAAGSTCYMRFTVPLDTYTEPAPERNEELMFEKVLGTDGQGNTIFTDEEFEFLLTLTNADGTPYYDIYDYAIYDRETTPNHRADGATPAKDKDGNELKGVMGDKIPESGKYTFKLKGGQYIVISNLPDNTYYTIEELSVGNYATLYQKGSHKHDKNGGQIDTLEGAVRYNYVVGSERINSEDYNYVCFTNSHAIKVETDPGDGKYVHIGDLITYEIEWGNDRNELADVVITDPLDDGLDFIGAGFKGADGTGENGYWEWNGSDSSYELNDECSIFYNKDTRTVVWTWKNRPAESSGVVELIVKVNESALEEETTAGKFGTMTSRVENQATIEIGNDHTIKTNIVENPVWNPIKTEVTPGAGKPVLPDSEIVYTITWKNYTNEAATVLVRDPLDKVVEYVNGSAAAYYGAYGSEDSSEIKDAKISYDPESHTIYWDLGEQEAGSEGYIIFTVNVKKEAVQQRIIWNWGYVQVGNDHEIETNHISNPVYGYELPATGGSGTLIYTISGLAIMLGSLVVWCEARRKRERRYSESSARGDNS